MAFSANNPFRLFFPIITDQRWANAEVIEQILGMAGVLGGDQVALLEDAQGNVLEVTDRGRDDIERAGGGRVSFMGVPRRGY
jgi:hypothetical protein